MPLGTYLLKNGYFGSRVFSLNAGPIALALTGMSRPHELTELEELHCNYPDPDAALRELLKAKGLEKRAKELLAWKRSRRQSEVLAAE
jgi:hypothetical protein